MNLFSRITSVEPSYEAKHCIAVSRSSYACKACREICPHEAISFKRSIVIDDIDCTGCGLCISVCPSQALDGKVTVTPAMTMKCSQVRGTQQTVNCLAKLEPSHYMQLANKEGQVKLAHNDCADCKIGTPAVLDAVAKNFARAQELAKLYDKSLTLEMNAYEHLDVTDNPAKLSRRDFFKGGVKEMQRGVADSLAPLDYFEKDDKSLPLEMQRQLRLIANSRPEAEEKVPWTLPRVDEDCIMCPICTRACPTEAFHRVFEDDGSSKLMLEPEKCNGCQACLPACPKNVISMEEGIQWSELTAGAQVAFLKVEQSTGDSLAR